MLIVHNDNDEANQYIATNSVCMQRSKCVSNFIKMHGYEFFLNLQIKIIFFIAVVSLLSRINNDLIFMFLFDIYTAVLCIMLPFESMTCYSSREIIANSNYSMPILYSWNLLLDILPRLNQGQCLPASLFPFNAKITFLILFAIQLSVDMHYALCIAE